VTRGSNINRDQAPASTSGAIVGVPLATPAVGCTAAGPSGDHQPSSIAT
jgi:hypothetical protein